MSLILDALKKSEAERQLGRAPGLTTPMIGVTRRRRAFLPLALVGVTAATLTGLGMWWLTRGGPVEVVVAPATSPQKAAPAQPVSAPPSAISTADDAHASREPAEAPKPAPIPASDSRPTTRAVVLPPPPIEPVAAPTVADPVEMTPALKPAPAPAAVPVEDLPRLDQLAPSEREALPPLKLSMHVWSEAPEGRFVLIDGHRYREGERLASSLQIVEIRRDGTVFDFNGRRFLLARP